MPKRSQFLLSKIMSTPSASVAAPAAASSSATATEHGDAAEEHGDAVENLWELLHFASKDLVKELDHIERENAVLECILAWSEPCPGLDKPLLDAAALAKSNKLYLLITTGGRCP